MSHISAHMSDSKPPLQIISETQGAQGFGVDGKLQRWEQLQGTFCPAKLQLCDFSAVACIRIEWSVDTLQTTNWPPICS